MLKVSDIFTPLLLSVCTGIASQYQPACQKSVEASYAQSGYQATINQFQNGAASYGRTKEESTFGDETWLVNTTASAAMIAKSKKANLNLPTFGVCDSFFTQVQINTLSFKWGWHW